MIACEDDNEEHENQGLTSIEVRLLLLISDEEFLFRIKAFGDVLEDGVAFPDHLIIVGMVDECRNAAIRVELTIFLRLMLFLGKVEDDFAGLTY